MRPLARRQVTLALLVSFGAYAVVAGCVGDDPDQDPSTTDAGTGPETNVQSDAGGSADTSTQDGSFDAGVDVDAAPACSLDKPFGTATLVPGAINTTGHETSFTLSEDQLTAYVTSDRAADGGTGYKIFSGTRGSPTDVFGTLNPVPSLLSTNAGFGTTSPTLTSDGKVVYFARGSAGDYDVWVATRFATNLDFGPPQLAPSPINVNGGGAGEDLVGWIAPDGKTLYFQSGRAGTAGRFDFYVSTLGGNGVWSAPSTTLVAGLNAEGLEGGIILTADELQVFISSERDGGPATDLYYSSRANKSVAFSPPTPITELNSAAHDEPVYVTPDGCTLYFVSLRTDGGIGGWDVYSATRGQ